MKKVRQKLNPTDTHGPTQVKGSCLHYHQIKNEHKYYCNYLSISFILKRSVLSSFPLFSLPFVASLQQRQPTMLCLGCGFLFCSSALRNSRNSSPIWSLRDAENRQPFLKRHLPGTSLPVWCHEEAKLVQLQCACPPQEPHPLPSQKCLTLLLASLEHLEEEGC